MTLHTPCHPKSFAPGDIVPEAAPGGKDNDKAAKAAKAAAAKAAKAAKAAAAKAAKAAVPASILNSSMFFIDYCRTLGFIVHWGVPDALPDLLPPVPGRCSCAWCWQCGGHTCQWST